jgi:membrane fusion protein (multidrug efflux system)
MVSRLRLSKFHMRGLVIVGLAALATIYFHYSRKSEVTAIREARSAAVESGPRVEVVTVVDGPKERLITLLADVRPQAVATLYSKVSGYLKSVSVDKGDLVETDQILAEIDSPELDQQYASAIADLDNKRKNSARIKDLSARGISTQVTSQQADTDAAIAEANVTGVASMKAYQYVRAPFNGRVASRFVDPGALITNAQTNFTSAQPLFTLSDDSRLRIYVYIQQQDVPFVHVGDQAEIVDASNPDRRIMASVSRMTGELDAKMRTMLVEVNIDNTETFLVPGSFAYVVLHVPVKTYPQVPVAGLIVRGADAVVATVENETVRFKTVKIASTDGSVANLSEGIQVGERIAINLPDEVTNGSRVRVVGGTQAR